MENFSKLNKQCVWVEGRYSIPDSMLTRCAVDLAIISNLFTVSTIAQYSRQRNTLHNPSHCRNRHPMDLQLKDKGNRWICNQRCEEILKAHPEMLGTLFQREV